MVEINQDTRYYRVNENNELNFTDIGLKHYRALFAKTGINIHEINTINKLKNAIEASEPYREDHIYNRAKKQNSLDSRTLVAIIDGDHDEFERNITKLKRKKELNLNVLKGHCTTQ